MINHITYNFSKFFLCNHKFSKKNVIIYQKNQSKNIIDSLFLFQIIWRFKKKLLYAKPLHAVGPNKKTKFKGLILMIYWWCFLAKVSTFQVMGYSAQLL